MGKGGEDSADYRACAGCARVCQTTHGEGLPHSVPKFFKAIPEYSMPSYKNCNLQIPAAYVREHMGGSVKENYILEGVTGLEWVATFSNVALNNGWKAFATDYQLEKGDQIMFALVAPKRFYVNVFDKFGMEKVSTRHPLNKRDSTGIVIDKEPELSPLKENPVSNSTIGGAEDPCSPLNLEKSSGAPQHDPEVLKSNGACANTPGNACGQKGNHKEVDKGSRHKRALIAKLLPHELGEPHESETSTMVESFADPDDTIEVLLAKAVIAKAKQKKLKRRTSCTPPQVKMVTEAINREGNFGAEVSKVKHNEDMAMNLRNVHRTSNGSARFFSDNLTDSPRDDGDDAMFEKPCEDPRILTDGINDHHIESQHQDRNDVDVVAHGRVEPQNHLIEATDQPGEVVQKVPVPNHGQNEAMGGAKTAREVTGEDPILNLGVEVKPTYQPSPVFQLGVVKEEPGLSLGNDLGPAIAVAGAHPGAACTGKCTNCGLATIAGKSQIFGQLTNLKSEPVTSESPETRRPSSDAPTKLRAKAVMSESPESPETRIPTPSSSGDDGRVTEYQKQRAYEAASTFSANTKNPNAIIVMRISFVEKKVCCFLSVKCSEMLPRVPTELILLDAGGCLRKVSWRPGKRYLQGPGWKDFVTSHNLAVNDVCVMEVIDNSGEQFKVLFHIFHARDMEKDQEQALPAPTPAPAPAPAPVPVPAPTPEALTVAQVTPGARTRLEEKRTRGANGPLLHGLLPSKRKKKSAIKAPDEVVQTGLTRPASTDAEIAQTSLRKPKRKSSFLLTPGTKLRKNQHGQEQGDPVSPEEPPSDLSPEQVTPSKRLRKRSESSKKRDFQGGPVSPVELPSDIAPEQATPSQRLRNRVQSSPSTGTELRSKLHGQRDPASPRVADSARTKKTSKRRRHSFFTPYAHKRASNIGAKASPQSASKVLEKQEEPRRRYTVVKTVDRRKSLQGMVFLVELKEAVVQSRGSKKMQAKQDERGRWWVPHNHFTADLSSCYIE